MLKLLASKTCNIFNLTLAMLLHYLRNINHEKRMILWSSSEICEWL